MNNAPPNRVLFDNILENGIKLGLLLALLFWGAHILAPFLSLLTWAGIIAIALYPVHAKFTTLLGGRNTTAATLMGLLTTALILVPMGLLVSQSMEAVGELRGQWAQGALPIPAPTEKVKDWPVIGERVYAAWHEAATDLSLFVEHFKPQIQEFGRFMVGTVASAGSSALFFTASFAVAAVFMATARAQSAFFDRLERRITGTDNTPYLDMTVATVRSVAQGIIGIAVVQALLAGAGMLVMDVPLSALWTFVVMVACIVQVPSLLVLGPIAAWGFSAYDTTPASLFAIWCVLVALSDNVLKPLLLGRGLDIPMLVILLGAIGGMLSMGVVGLFIGSVVLAIVYRLFMTWMEHHAPAPSAGGD